MHTAIRSWPDKIGEEDWRSRLAMKIGDADWRGDEDWRGRKQGGRRKEGGGGGGRTTVIKSNNPHLAGGEQQKHQFLGGLGLGVGGCPKSLSGLWVCFLFRGGVFFRFYLFLCSIVIFWYLGHPPKSKNKSKQNKKQLPGRSVLDWGWGGVQRVCQDCVCVLFLVVFFYLYFLYSAFCQRTAVEMSLAIQLSRPLKNTKMHLEMAEN